MFWVIPPTSNQQREPVGLGLLTRSGRNLNSSSDYYCHRQAPLSPLQQRLVHASTYRHKKIPSKLSSFKENDLEYRRKEDNDQTGSPLSVPCPPPEKNKHQNKTPRS